MVGWRKIFVLIADGSVVVLVEMDTFCPILARLNFAKDGEHELNDDRFNTSAGGRGSCRGKQKSRRAAWCEIWGLGDQAGGTKGIIKRRADFIIVRCGDNNVGLNGDPVDISLHRALLLTVVHVEQILELARSCRRRVPIIFFN